MNDLTRKRYDLWMKSLKNVNKDDFKELESIKDEEIINDMFYKELEFGTGGLRGVMGLGTNRMNEYIVKKASLGIANFLVKNYENPSIAIGYDSRNNSEKYAHFAASTYASKGIHVYIYDTLEPTPLLSYAVRTLHCSAGVIVTASHNPSKYNGYKVYNDEGCQIGVEAANEILGYINKVDIFNEIKNINDFESLFKDKKIEFISHKVVDQFIEDTLKISITNDFRKKSIKIVYTPLNGTGLIPVTRTLKAAGFENIIVPIEQKNPDGNFPTCPYPNPEILEAMQVGISYCEKENADLLIATDPDCDRCGIGVRYNGSFRLLSGNETGTLLLDFILNHSKLPLNPITVRSIVSTSAVDKIAAIKGLEVKKVLTGFKYIGDIICKLEKNNEENRYIFGFEESYGYLTNPKVRDKDAVNASLIIAEMFAYYKARNINLIDQLYKIYDVIGYHKNSLLTYAFEGEAGMNTMKSIMNDLRILDIKDLSKKFNSAVDIKNDYKNSISINKDNIQNVIDIEKTNMLSFIFDDKTIVTCRPSGTEPKIKFYIETVGKNVEDTESINNKYKDIISKLIESYK